MSTTGANTTHSISLVPLITKDPREVLRGYTPGCSIKYIHGKKENSKGTNNHKAHYKVELGLSACSNLYPCQGMSEQDPVVHELPVHPSVSRIPSNGPIIYNKCSTPEPPSTSQRGLTSDYSDGSTHCNRTGIKVNP